VSVTTRDIERLAVRVKAEINALAACAPAHSDMIATAVLSRVAGDLLGATAVAFIGPAAPASRAKGGLEGAPPPAA